MALPAVDKGNSIGQHDTIRKHHNSFARQDPFTIEEDQSRHGKEDDDVYHFVSYVPHNGQLYELDGLQNGPISFGEVTEENWLVKAKEEIQKRIEKYASSEIRFNLLAVIDDKKVKAEKELAALQGQQGKEAEIEVQKQIIAEEDEKQQRWKTENERRRHNYVPLIFELLQQLAKKDMLHDMFEEAKEAKKKKDQEKKENEEKQKAADKAKADADMKN